VNRLGLHACFNLLLLNPDSTLEDLAANAAFLRRRPHNPMNFCRTEIYAGTPLERKLRGQGRLLGNYFGYDYRIADARAEAACDAIYTLFRTRNWSLDGLHSQVMHVDYENTLLVHFHASAVPGKGRGDALTRDVKSFIEQANLNSAGYLDEVVAMAASAPSATAGAGFLDDVSRRMRADEAILRAAGDALLRRIRGRAEELSRSRHAGKHATRSLAAAAGLVATVAVAGPGCDCSRRDHSHFSEMVAAPHVPDAKQAPPDASTLPANPDAEIKAKPVGQTPKLHRPKTHFHERAPDRGARPPQEQPPHTHPNEEAPDWTRDGKN
jgi:hypothetical protein